MTVVKHVLWFAIENGGFLVAEKLYSRNRNALKEFCLLIIES